MNVIPTSIPDVLILEPKIFGDERGFMMETYNQSIFNQTIGRDVTFVQDNHSRSTRGVLRGLHYQIEKTQAKLLRVTVGEVFDVVVDLRRSSETFGKWVGVTLSADNQRQLWVPEGFAHGFMVLSDTADCLYKTTDFYSPQFERILAWNDATIGIEWPSGEDPILSAKDRAGVTLQNADLFR